MPAHKVSDLLALPWRWKVAVGPADRVGHRDVGGELPARRRVQAEIAEPTDHVEVRARILDRRIPAHRRPQPALELALRARVLAGTDVDPAAGTQVEGYAPHRAVHVAEVEIDDVGGHQPAALPRLAVDHEGEVEVVEQRARVDVDVRAAAAGGRRAVVELAVDARHPQVGHERELPRRGVGLGRCAERREQRQSGNHVSEQDASLHCSLLVGSVLAPVDRAPVRRRRASGPGGRRGPGRQLPPLPGSYVARRPRSARDSCSRVPVRPGSRGRQGDRRSRCRRSTRGAGERAEQRARRFDHQHPAISGNAFGARASGRVIADLGGEDHRIRTSPAEGWMLRIACNACDVEG